jgi:hypothetical protein
MLGHIEGLAEGFLDQIGTDTSFELVEKFAYPLPSWVITENAWHPDGTADATQRLDRADSEITRYACLSQMS